jgi:signal transduction histidine kinase
MTTIRRAGRDVLYNALGSLAGIVGFVVVVLVLLPGLAFTVTIIGTVVGLLLVTVSLRLAVRLGSLHRRLLAGLLHDEVPPPAPFQRGTGVLGRLDRRLRYRPGWRAVSFVLVKLPMAVMQVFAVSAVVCGLLDLTYPVAWLVVRHHGHHAGTWVAHTVGPLPLGMAVSSWPDTLGAVSIGVLYLLGGVWLGRGATALDRWLIRGLLGPNRLDERVSQLERTRALAVDDAAAALRRVERDLHDGAQMRLAALAMNLGMAQDKLGDTDEDDASADTATARELIAAAHRNALDALTDLRDLARGIHPPALDNGLAVALESLAASSAIPAAVSAALPGRPAPAIETIAYFCAAELIANATKHSYANQIKIKIYSERTGVLLLSVSDDGIGGASQGRGSGLDGLAHRVSTVDGRIGISSPDGGPTVVTVELPMRAGNEG